MNETFSGEPQATAMDTASVTDVVMPPWEQIAPGRYMPRRIRGSCLGRELG